jgi:tripartite-type tricarboxylate transporter receptor subunit TctC
MGTQWLMKKTEYDPIKDFTPIVAVAQSPNILLVTPSSGIKSVKELIAIAKAKPGILNYSYGGFASAAQLAGELFKYMAGVNITGVAYAGTGAQINAILLGEVQLSFAQSPIASQYIKSGRVIALGVTTLSPTPLAPGLPTVASLGLPGFEATSIDVMLAPVNSPQAAVRRLNQDIVKFLSQPDIKEKFIGMGSEVIASTPEGLSVIMTTEIKRMGKVVKDANLRVE